MHAAGSCWRLDLPIQNYSDREDPMYDTLAGLSDTEWRRESSEYPRDYGGYWPGREGYLRVGIGRSRDSDLLEESNYIAAVNALREAEDGLDGEDGVIEHSASHWAVGWVESLWIADLPEMREAVRKLWDALAQYPVLDEDDFSARESEAFSQLVREAVQDALGWKLPDELEAARADLTAEDERHLDYAVDRYMGRDFSDPDSLDWNATMQRAWSLLRGGRTDVATVP